MRYVLAVVSEKNAGFEWTQEWPHLVISPQAAAEQVRDGDLVGTSLPELIFSIIAVKSGHAEMAIGNVFGSNIFNILMVMGAA